MEQIDDTKPYVFSYYIREISESPFTISFIARDEEDAIGKWADWVETLKFTIESNNIPQLVKS